MVACLQVFQSEDEVCASLIMTNYFKTCVLFTLFVNVLAVVSLGSATQKTSRQANLAV